MSDTAPAKLNSTARRTCLRRSGKRSVWVICLLLTLSLLPVLADEDEDQYFAVLDLVQKADALDSSGQFGKALAKYQQAQAALQAFRKEHGDWNPKVIAYRTKYLADKIESCSEKLSAPPATAPKTQPTTVSEGGTKSVDRVSGTEVKLIEPGGEPRRALRFHPTQGEKQTVEMTLKMSMGMKIGEMENPAMKMPSMNMVLSSTIKSISPDGDISSDIVMVDAGIKDDPGVMPQMADAMKSTIGNLKGLSGTWLTTERGLSKGVRINIPQGAEPQARQVMDQMKDSLSNLGMALPEEAVGPGAKWEVRMQIKSQGMNIDQVATYSLSAVQGDTLSTAVTINQTAPQQKIENPAMPGLKIDLTSMAGTGTGKLQLNLGQLLPMAGDLTSRSDLVMGVGAGTQKQTMKMSIDVAMQIESK